MMVTHQELMLIKERTGKTFPTKLVRKNRYLLLPEAGCPFLNQKNECAVYDIRPCQCRLYHCGRLKPTDKRLETINQIRELMAKNPEYDAYKRKEEAEAMEWGNAHGWEWRKIEK